MADLFDSSPQDAAAGANELDAAVAGLTLRTDALADSANGFSNAMARAFVSATVAGRSFDDVLKNLALRISSLAVADAFKPLTAASATVSARSFPGRFQAAAWPCRAGSSRSLPGA
jgi:hypothetical protein